MFARVVCGVWPILVVICSVNCFAAGALGQSFFLNTVSWGVSGDVNADFGHAKQINSGDISSGTGLVSLDGAASESVETPAPHLGSASAFVQLSASALQGELHAKIDGGGHAFNGGGSGNNTGFGSAHIGLASVIARWQDTAVVSFDGLPGQSIIAAGTLVIDGPMSVTITGDPVDNRDAQAQVRLQLRGEGIPSPPNNGYFGYSFDNLGHSGSVVKPPPLIVPTAITMKNGEAHTIDYSLELSATAVIVSNALTAGFGDARFFANFSQTVRWGGITSVRNAATGAPITNWTITSASGFDYSHGVPEPSCVVLLMTMVAMLPMRRPRMCRRG